LPTTPLFPPMRNNRTPGAIAAVLLLATLPAIGTEGQARAGFVWHSVSGVESHDRPSWDSVLNDPQGGGGDARPQRR